MDKRKSWKLPFGGRKKEEMERLAEHSRNLEMVLEQERAERERTEQAEKERREREERIQAELQNQLAQARAEQQAQERIDWERRVREGRERQVKLEKQNSQRKERIRRLQIITPESLRTLRELIRARYALDVKIWGLRDVRMPDRPIAEAHMERADAILHEIYEMVYAWDNTQTSWTPAEWEQAMEVKRRLLSDGKRWWSVSGPPWDDATGKVSPSRSRVNGNFT